MPRLYLSPPHMGPDERALLLDAFDSNWIAPLGPHVDAFEAELAAVVSGDEAVPHVGAPAIVSGADHEPHGDAERRTAHATPHVAALSSGTAALHLALRLLGVSPGDRVWVSSFTFAASANAVTYLGATPVLVDSEPRTWNIDPDLVAEELPRAAQRGELPKALIAVDLYGQCADYARLQAACAPYEVPIIEDAAEALGARYHGAPAGSFGALSAFSFNGNKIITTSGGGALCGSSQELILRARALASQAREPFPHYEHREVGYNYRLSNLLAAVGRGQLRQLSSRVAARRAHFERYVTELGELPGLSWMPEPEGYFSTRWLTCLLLEPSAARATPEALRLALEAEDIEARPLWKPMHLQPAFQGCQALGGAVSERLFATGLCLPSGSAMTSVEQDRVIDVLRRHLA
ncbi:MAG: aminotransferase class I/II-fold pyridoxal phosphate-dependent enzyme [Polyangiaceae bacterium]|nr:aminotransferase class I/II-fold pyridoxal phosphate-dependent enzyme [Polyangiaceae bacterium]MCW5791020.1 aminotransferase class I/II-fold pyridoxal phosphate-dependent enzyme [Polyangiaceae bacterium]